MAQYIITLFLGVNLLFADIFIVSYQAQVKDSMLLHESLTASKAMTLSSNEFKRPATIFLDKECSKKKFFICYKEKILDFLFKEGVYIDAREAVESLVSRSSFVELTVPPQYLQVEFNDTFVKIALLK